MGIIDNIITAFNQTKKATDKTIKESMPSIEALNRGQLKMGLNGLGNNISPMYELDYEHYKETLSSYGLDGSTPDLFLSGNFYKSIDAKLKGNTVTIDSGLSYASDLKQKYGKDILNLAPISQVSYRSEIHRKLADEISKIWR